MPDYCELSLYSRAGSDRKYLNVAERRRALSAMGEFEKRRALFGLTLAWTGSRVSESLSLVPISFQVDRGIVAIRTLKRRRESVREVPIPPELMAELDREFRLTELQQNPDTAHKRLWPWRRETAWRFIKDVMNRAGVVGQRACPRGLRHAFGVQTLHAGVPINLVQRWLGHARISTTAIYAAASGPEELYFAARFWRAAPEAER